MESKGKYYLTTAIAYTSAKPHIGNNYEIVLADSIARFKRKEGAMMFFSRLVLTRVPAGRRQVSGLRRCRKAC